jgi:hypothetical protein
MNTFTHPTGYQALQAGPPGKILIIPDHAAGLS